MKVPLLLAVALGITSTVHAQTRHISTQTIVWNSEDDMSAGLRLLSAHASFEDVAPYIACMPDPGDAVVILDAGFTKHEIQVTSGENRGCRGWVPAEHVR